jgi:serine protease AprX
VISCNSWSTKERCNTFHWLSPVVTMMDVTNPAIGADQVWAGWGGLLLGAGSYRGVTGQGVGVAIVDSGIATRHAALSRQVIASVDLASNATGITHEFGHGTHVAGIVAGQATTTGGASIFGGGTAPGAQVINVRLLGGDGTGYTSDVMAGIDWVIANRQRYNIRVMNLSLGHPVMEPCAVDPLCQAVARAYSAGVVVVASAGNGGRTADGAMVLGGISSPGNSPFAITVGALNTHGTSAREEDTVASFSSRGPTKFDFAVKPDLVAPGVRIVAPEAVNSWIGSVPSCCRWAS